MGSPSGVRLIDFPTFADSRGKLSTLEEGGAIPFGIRRVFFMHHMTADRGGHAHRDTQQVVLAAHGAFRITVADGLSRAVFVLDAPERGVYLPPMTFITLEDFSPGAVCLVLADTLYDMSRSIRSYSDFLREVQSL